MSTDSDNNTYELLSEQQQDAASSSASHEKLVLDEVVDRDTVGSYTGTTKWFNDKLGFGFVTICEGEDKGKDIFVHHTGICPLNSNYRTLKKGEYINFNIITGMNGLQAVDVTGINGGPLMCDHVAGKKEAMVPVFVPVARVPRAVECDSQWQTVHARRSASKYDSASPVRGKRFPPNNRPYKLKQSSE